MLSFLRQRWFLIVLIATLVAGIAWPGAMRPVVDRMSGDAILAIVTFIMALPLETGVLWRAVRRPGPAWLGAVLNSGIAPPLGWLASLLLPSELAVGLVLAATVPTTLASAAVWTRRAGGNDAVAFLVTMITNLGCFLVIPAWLTLLIGIRAEVDFGKIVLGLILLVVLPIIVAQLLRQWPPVGAAATRHKPLLSGIAQIGVLSMVLVGAVMCGDRLAAVDGNSIVSVPNVAILLSSVIALHVVLVALGFTFSRLLSIAPADAIAVAFAGSQKTLMVGTYLAMVVGPLAILPMVAYHAAQLVIDTLIADWLRQRDDVNGLDPEL
ncbi:MAG: bile acid:sodium symporter [Planctomycetes bacterium]|nr:bile acid:sodium symporter [Planctomycetota bacterium]